MVEMPLRTKLTHGCEMPMLLLNGNNEADQLNIDVSRIVVRNENHGAFIALKKVAAQATKRKMSMNL